MASWKADVSGSLDSYQGFRGLQSLKERTEQNIQLCQIFTVLDERAKVRKKKIKEKKKIWLLVLIFC